MQEVDIHGMHNNYSLDRWHDHRLFSLTLRKLCQSRSESLTHRPQTPSALEVGRDQLV